MNSKGLNRQFLSIEKTGFPDTIIGTFRKKIRGLIQERWADLHPAGIGIAGGETIKQINSSLNGLIRTGTKDGDGVDLLRFFINYVMVFTCLEKPV